ncbi:hypothetical protein ANH9381_0784 [Aggregatibacter actinomycetemcomitans ANH9381]|nr:hypothetical protein ANH9381_0784 [Aggregatibacter actinomycetemcomitans ANH9381]
MRPSYLTNHGLCIDEKATGSASYELVCQISLGRLNPFRSACCFFI